MAKEKTPSMKMLQGLLFAGSIMIYFAPDVPKEGYVFAGLMALTAFLIELYYYIKK